MTEKMIAVRLNSQLERERRGICDPEDPRNTEVITPSNYCSQGYLRVYPSGFILAQIQAGVLVRIPDRRPPRSGSTTQKATGSRQSPARRKIKGTQR